MAKSSKSKLKTDKTPVELLTALLARIERLDPTLHAFIRQLAIPDAEKQRLLELTPSTYIGLAARLARTV